MIRDIAIVLYLIFVTSWHSQGQNPGSVIEKDYLSLLQGLLEIKNEIRSNTDKNILRELKTAQTELINDYVNGQYSFFSRNAIVEIALNKKSNTGVEENIKPFLINYTAKEYKEIFIDVENVVPNHDNTGWYDVFFVSRGEVSSGLSYRVAIVALENGQYKIRRISFKNSVPISTSKEEVEIADTPIVKKEEVIPIIPNDPVPEIVLEKIQFSDEEGLYLQGSIRHPFPNAQLKIESVDLKIVSIVMDSNGKNFTIKAAKPQQRSNDITFKYQLGEKYFTDKKNIWLQLKESSTH